MVQWIELVLNSGGRIEQNYFHPPIYNKQTDKKERAGVAVIGMGFGSDNLLVYRPGDQIDLNARQRQSFEQ